MSKIISTTILFGAVILITISCHNPKPQPKTEKPFQSIQLEQVQSPATNSLRGMSVVDEKVAWISGAKGSILRTIDGGTSWEMLSAPDTDSLDYRSIHAFDEQEAIIASAGFPCRIYKTRDGGQSWELVYENLDSAAFINSIAFKNETEGLVLGDQMGKRHLWLVTMDRGNNWNRIDDVFTPMPLKVENGFAASGSCIAIDHMGHYYIGLGGEKSRVFYTSNLFKWETQNTPMPAGSGSSGIYSIASGGENIMAVGGDYTQVDSAYHPVYFDRASASWKSCSGRVSGYRSVVDYAETGDFWVCAGTNGVEISFDFGASWEKISDLNINTLRIIPSTSRMLMANSKGEIYSLEVVLPSSES